MTAAEAKLAEQRTSQWRWSQSVFAQTGDKQRFDFAGWAETLAKRVHLKVLEVCPVLYAVEMTIYRGECRQIMSYQTLLERLIVKDG